MSCKDCLHYEICEALYEMNGISKIFPSQCAFYKNNKMSNWISVKDRPPAPEEEVFIQTENGIMTTAMYEDGTISTDDSIWNWYDLDFDYDEKNDKYLVPEGWWECRHYNPDDVYNFAVDDVVTHWMPLPEPPKGE